MTEIIRKLREIDWDFSDYNSTRYPFDLNSIPWYPATFVPPIPKILIASLTKPGDVVLDPFGGSGTTVIEALKLNRLPIYNDLNPFAADIVKSLISSIKYAINGNDYFIKEKELCRLKAGLMSKTEAFKFLEEKGINKDVFEWYHIDSLIEILSIIKLIETEDLIVDDSINMIRRLAVSAILKPACSQPGHFTYITDNCKPKTKVYKDAISLYVDKIEQICLSAEDFLFQYRLAFPNADLNNLINNMRIETGDSRNLFWIDDQSVDLVLTSPPYLCAQDYIKTMRLTNLFFPNEDGFYNTVNYEIGPRCLRRGKSDIVVPGFYRDLKCVFSHVERVLKPKGIFCLIMGQGKSKITANYDTISDLCNMIQGELGFEQIFHCKRNISNRVIRIGGVDKEDVYIFRSKK